MSSIFPQNSWQGRRFHDPWWKAEAWRYEHPLVAKKYLKWKVLPGFGYASVAFAIYCAAEYISGGNSSHGGNHRPSGHDKHSASTSSAHEESNVSLNRSS